MIARRRDNFALGWVYDVCAANEFIAWRLQEEAKP